MPFTPYHFGPSAFLGLVFRKWLDVPVFVLANIIVDLEVLIITIFGLGYPRHRYCHTLLIGLVLGILWGVAAYPLRHIFNRLMQLIHIPYQTGLLKMLISGVLGVWLHVLIDGIYHWDIRVFWPSHARPLYGLLDRPIRGEGKAVCLAFFAAAVIVYVIMLVRSCKSKADQSSDRKF
jgi:membrane-bound metal-dependent hydrolase YbcI (DUF457 family)